MNNPQRPSSARSNKSNESSFMKNVMNPTLDSKQKKEKQELQQYEQQYASKQQVQNVVYERSQSNQGEESFPLQSNNQGSGDQVYNMSHGMATGVKQNQVKDIFYSEPQETRQLPAPWQKKTNIDKEELEKLTNNIERNMTNPIADNRMQDFFNYNERPNEYEQTLIVDQHIVRNNIYKEYPVGKSKNHQQYIENIHNQPAGTKHKQQPLTAKDCIFNSQPDQCLQPDKDLGKPVVILNKKLIQNIPSDEIVREPSQIDRYSGIPTIRDDLKPRGYVSLANKQPYSYQSVGQVMKEQSYNPISGKFGHETMQEQAKKPNQEQVKQAMGERKNKLELRQLYKSIGFEFSDQEFDRYFYESLKQDHSNDNLVSLSTFNQILQLYKKK